jgi:hypothetical protein
MTFRPRVSAIGHLVQVQMQVPEPEPEPGHPHLAPEARDP